MLADLKIKPRPRTKISAKGTKCVVCQRSFKGKQNQISCSSICKRALNMAKVKVRRLRERGIANDGKLPIKKCVTCGELFEQKQDNFITCGKGECIRLRNIQTNRRWSSTNKELPIKKCIICRDSFQQKQTNYITCGKKTCIKQRSLDVNKRRLEPDGV